MTKKSATIAVVGPIGTFTVMENGKPRKTVGMQLVDFSRQLTRLEDGVTDVTIEVGGMGGSVPVAKAMRQMIKAYSGRINFTTKQIDDIASAHTIIFSSAPNRLAAKGINQATGKEFFFLVHNPWVGHSEGTADDLEQDSKDLRATEDELVAIYREDTGIDQEAIAPLMKVETVFNADQALDLGFATGTYQALNQAAYKSATSSNNSTMKNKNQTLAQRVLAALGISETGDKIVATAPPAELMGKPVMIEGAAAVDGVYTVVGGVITALGEAPEGQAPAAAAPAAAGAAAPAGGAAAKPVAMTREQVIALINEATKSTKKKGAAADPDDEEEEEEPSETEKIAIAVAKAINANVDKKMDEFGKRIKTSHVPVGFKPETKVEDAKEWDRSFKAGEHVAMRRDEPEKWQRLFYAKYGRMPS